MIKSNNKNTVRITQLALMLLLILEGGKFINLPSYVARENGRDGWLTFILLFALDAAVLVSLLLSIKNNPDRLSVETIFKHSLGVVTTKLLLALYFAFFLLRILDLCIAASELFSATLTLQTNWLGFILPVLCYVIFSAKKGIKTVARVSDILGLYIILASVAMTVLSLAQVDFTELAPVLEEGFGNILFSLPRLCFWFADSLFIMFLMKDISPEKKLLKAPITAFLIGSIIITMLYVVFYCIFGGLAQHHHGAIAKVAQFNSALIFKGRLDWLTLIFWTLSVFIKLALMTYCCLTSFDALFGLKPKNSPSLPAIILFSAILIVVPVLTPLSSFARNLFSSPLAYVPLIIIEYVVPFLMPLLTKKAYR